MGIDLPKEFFTAQSMLTLTGATGATFVISNGCQKALDFNPKWLALAIAIAICLFGVVTTGGRAADYIVGVVNGFLVYCTAAGATGLADTAQVAPAISEGTRGARNTSLSPRRKFLSRWW